jgi:hypothetical protein
MLERIKTTQMWLDNTSKAAIELFWQLSGNVEPFPRDLERSVALALPLSVIKLARLKLDVIEKWLATHDVHFSFGCRTRAVRGCLIAFRGEGLIFLDGTDSMEEQRFTLAHEIGHFLIDYWLPRQKAIGKLGPSISEVIDGLRDPSVTERLHGLLSGVPITLYTRLMERDETPEGNHGIWEIEDRADKVGLALLAPPEIVLAEAGTSTRFEERSAAMTKLLSQQFGLPSPAAVSYARALLNSVGRGRSWAEGLRSGAH